MTQFFRTLFASFLVIAMAAHAQVVPPPPKAAVPTPAAPALGARSYVLMDFASGQLIVDKQPDLRVEPASITKLMTGYVLFHEIAEGNIALDEKVPVSETAWRTGGSRMFIEPGMEVSVEDLLRGMIIQSGNDASVLLAERAAGSEEAFATLMNHWATQLGLENTHFVNATGMPAEEHYTTARDVALLSAAIIRDFPDFYTMYSEKEFSFKPDSRDEPIRQHNRNTLLWRDPAVDGLKTGHTESAGYCLASSAARDGMRLISVVMGSSSESQRASDSQTLLGYGFRFFETVKLYEGGQELADARVWRGEAENVKLGIENPLVITIPRGRYDDLEATMELRPRLSAPLGDGEAVGELRVTLDDERVAARPLVTLAAVPEAGFFGRNWDSFKLWVGGFFEDDEEDRGEGDGG